MYNRYFTVLKTKKKQTATSPLIILQVQPTSGLSSVISSVPRLHFVYRGLRTVYSFGVRFLVLQKTFYPQHSFHQPSPCERVSKGRERSLDFLVQPTSGLRFSSCIYPPVALRLPGVMHSYLLRSINYKLSTA